MNTDEIKSYLGNKFELWGKEPGELHNDLEFLVNEVDQLQAENDELLQAIIDLLSPWWITSNRYCYWCGEHQKTNLHTDDCPRKRATETVKKLRSNNE